MNFGQHVCFLELDLNETETVALVADLHAKFGRRIRTTTKTRWLHDAERAPVPPMGKPGHYGNLRHIKLRPSIGARADR